MEGGREAGRGERRKGDRGRSTLPGSVLPLATMQW